MADHHADDEPGLSPRTPPRPPVLLFASPPRSANLGFAAVAEAARGDCDMLYQLDQLTPQVADPARLFLAPNSVVVGNVIIAEDVSFWFGAVARGDNEPMRIGAGTNIQDGAVLHSDPGRPLTIGAGCTIGHQAMLHGCTVGDNTLVGIGAVVLNGARIGHNCLIGARALVTEDKVIPDNRW